MKIGNRKSGQSEHGEDRQSILEGISRVEASRGGYTLESLIERQCDAVRHAAWQALSSALSGLSESERNALGYHRGIDRERAMNILENGAGSVVGNWARGRHPTDNGK
jgi:hypothetical protein